MITSTTLSARRQGRSARARGATLIRQSGGLIVEFALVALLFFTIIFTIMEISRALYLWNALQEVTRRAAREAAVTNFADAGAIAQLKYRAIFRNAPGELILGDPITDQHIRIEYLSLQSETNSKLNMVAIPALPVCPTRNKITCTAKSGDPNCIRMVRVRICEPGDGAACNPIPYKSLFPLVNFPMNLPTSETVVRAGSLGYEPGMPTCD